MSAECRCLMNLSRSYMQQRGMATFLAALKAMQTRNQQIARPPTGACPRPRAGSATVAHVGENWHTYGTRLHSVCWHSTTDGNIATPIIVLTSRWFLCLIKFCELWSSNPWDLVVHLHGWVGAHLVKIRCALVFESHSLRGSSTIAFAPSGLHAAGALPRFGFLWFLRVSIRRR